VFVKIQTSVTNVNSLIKIKLSICVFKVSELPRSKRGRGGEMGRDVRTRGTSGRSSTKNVDKFNITINSCISKNHTSQKIISKSVCCFSVCIVLYKAAQTPHWVYCQSLTWSNDQFLAHYMKVADRKKDTRRIGRPLWELKFPSI